MESVAAPERHRLVALLSNLIAVAFLALIPVRVLLSGFLPPDDALRHAAKVVSGREWSEILVLRPEFTQNSHPGWHAILGALHALTGCPPIDLVFFSVLALFLCFHLAPLAFVARAEAWLISLLALHVFDAQQLTRLMLGRPFIFTAAGVAIWCVVWPRLAVERVSRRGLALLVGFVAASTWIHGSWYLLALPIAAAALARQRRLSLRLLGCTAVGILLGALATGHPWRFLYEAVLQGFLARGTPQAVSTMAVELRPFAGEPLVVGALLAFLSWRQGRRKDRPGLARDPAFLLVVSAWALGYVSVRFYVDWGVPALLGFLATEIGHEVESRIESGNLGRLALCAALGLMVFLAASSDTAGRWSDVTESNFLALDNPEHAPCLPEPGGIVYNTDMPTFYRTFFRNPRGPWRYMVGFEPALMPEAELAIYREILRSRGSTDSYLRWASKMKPQDRMIVHLTSNIPPPVPSLEWYQPVYATWCGRLPRAASATHR